MFNSLTKNMLSQVSKSDGEINVSQICFCVSDSFSTIEMYISEDKVSFRVSGEPYIVAMSKWLQCELQNGSDLSSISLQYLVKLFEIPVLKYRSAMMMIDLIEKINEG